MPHAITTSGFALDPQLRALERRLADIAAAWRGAEGQPERAAAFVAEYHATMHTLIANGWDPTVGELDYEDTLPDELMPEVYRHRYDPVSVQAARSSCGEVANGRISSPVGVQTGS